MTWLKPIPPSEAIDNDPHSCVSVNANWIKHILGRVYPMAFENFWGGSAEENYNAAQQVHRFIEMLEDGSDRCMIPIGGVIIWTDAVIPDRYLKCDGAAVATADYPELFELIGYTYGGSGANFNVPNLVGRFPFGAYASRPLASTGGTEFVALTVNQIPPHSHGISTRVSAVSGTGERLMRASGAQTEVTDTQDAGGGSSHENMPPYIAMHYVIRGR